MRLRPDLRAFGIRRHDLGFIYILEDRDRLKIGKTRDRQSRFRAAKTWIPDASVLGVKPFWNVSSVERSLHAGFSQDWYAGEWFQFDNTEDRDLLIEGFLEFSDDDPDINSVDFVYWFNSFGMAEFVIEQNRQGVSLRRFLRQESSK